MNDKQASDRLVELMEQNIKLIGGWINEVDDVKRQAARAKELPLVEANIAEMERLLFSSHYAPPQQVLDNFFELVRSLNVAKSRSGL